MPDTYVVTIDPVTANEDAVLDVLNEHAESRQRARAILESGGAVTETSVESEAEAVAARLRQAGATVDVERRASRSGDRDAFVVSGVVRSDPVDDVSFDAVEGIGANRAAELGELGYETVADVAGADRTDLAEAHDVGEELAERVLEVATGRTVSGVTVRAYDRDLRTERLLGEDVTDEDGRYEITYSPDRFRGAEQGGPDLVFRVFHAGGAELDADADRGTVPQGDEGAPRVLFDADPVETVDLTVDAPEPPERVEYERVEATLGPLLDGVAPADLDGEDVWFLVNESDVERALVEAFAASARLARETGLRPEPFYGLLREGLPAELEDLLEVAPETLTASLEAAVEEDVVREGVLDSLDDLLDRFEELRAPARPRVRYEVVATVVRAETQAPLANHSVAAVDATAESERALGEGSTDADGRVELGFALPEAAGRDHRVRFVVRDPRGVERRVAERTLEPDGDDPVAVDLVVPEPARPGATGLDDPTLRDALRRSAQDGDRVEALITALEQREEPVTDLADIREAGGLARLLERTEDPPVSPDDPAVDLLDAHVYLSLLSPDPAVNAALIERGYRDPFAVANAPRSEFVDSVSGEGGELTAVEAARMHRSARAQRYAANNVLTTLLTDRANGFATAVGEVE